MARHSAPLLGREMATPANPPSGARLLYSKSDGWYEKNSAGVETKLASSSSVPLHKATHATGGTDALTPADIGAAPLPVWQAWTPAWTATTTNPTLGNGTLTGRYVQTGKTVHFNLVLTIGSTTGFGSGSYRLNLPVNGRNGNEMVLSGIASSPNKYYLIRGIIDEVPAIFLVPYDTVATSALSSTNHGWAAGTILRISGTYEAA